MSKIQVVPICIAVFREGDNPVFGETAIHVCIEDDAAGPFIVLKQFSDDSKAGQVKLDPDEIDVIASVAKGMLAEHQKLSNQPTKDITTIAKEILASHPNLSKQQEK